MPANVNATNLVAAPAVNQNSALMYIILANEILLLIFMLCLWRKITILADAFWYLQSEEQANVAPTNVPTTPVTTPPAAPNNRSPRSASASDETAAVEDFMSRLEAVHAVGERQTVHYTELLERLRRIYMDRLRRNDHFNYEYDDDSMQGLNMRKLP